jgi:SAM-dependent methyltransferase
MGSSFFVGQLAGGDPMANDRQFDPTAIKAQQREQWSNVAQGWRQRWPTFERGAQPLSDRLLELAHVGPGMHVLDVATGIGEPAMTAARWVGPSGSVVAIDQAPQMLDVARERLLAAGVDNVELNEGDAEAIALPPDAFDAILCRWGLMFFSDRRSTLARLRATIFPDGWLAAAIWGAPQRVPIIALSFAALAGEPGQPPTPPPGPNPFDLSEPAALEQLLRDAGYRDVRSEPLTVTFEFASVDELLGHIGDTSAPVRAILATRDYERQATFWRNLASAVSAYADPDSVIRLPNECLIVAGRR